MKLLKGLRVSHKISALMVGLILGFIIIGITYYIQINVDKNIRAQEQQARDYQRQLTELTLLQVEAYSLAKQYMATPQERVLERFNERAGEIQGQLDSLAENAALTGEGRQALEQIDSQVSGYTEVFHQGVESLSRLGADQSAGLRGELAELGEQLSNQLAGAGLTDQLAGYYQLRARQNRLLSRTTELNPQAYRQTFQAWQSDLASTNVPAAARQSLTELTDDYGQAVDQLVTTLGAIEQVEGELQTLEAGTREAVAGAMTGATGITEQLAVQGAEQKQVLDAVVTAIIFAVAIGTAVGIYLIYKSIVFPMVHMQSVIRKINRGKTNARVKVLAQDELGELGLAFNKLLDERIQQLEEQSKENDKLNNSIISLIRALGMIAQKDLTVKVPVSADITGTISDAVNLFTRETAKTLHQVRDISEQVNDVSSQLDEQSVVVGRFAENERRQILATSKALEVLANAMNDIAQRSEAADKAANQAIDSTRGARETVVETVSGIRTIRETISETEKRVKRLGDRSQEVSGIVNLINTIAERTHILALNASMHAASAGEAGKGFAVVADEVQRLAENARQSTDEISAMVNSMRVDTADTVNIMNTLISQVADGTRLAEQAGQRMQATEESTQELVENVKVIAGHAVQQAEVANRVKERSTVIRSFTEKTGKQLEEQRKQTEGLKKWAATLVEQVAVFKLPEQEGESETREWTDNVRPLPPAAEVS